jgi:hypothetical protein
MAKTSPSVTPHVPGSGEFEMAENPGFPASIAITTTTLASFHVVIDPLIVTKGSWVERKRQDSSTTTPC